ncbi:hypothetical protein BHE74_00022158 [Ensete ventricosum]|nr:hypothetical protein GW17_00007295 [Ensete ventricosum]RWW70172.1 hypothetical protein BHE74_00022158 [Ensete ventricosum]
MTSKARKAFTSPEDVPSEDKLITSTSGLPEDHTMTRGDKELEREEEDVGKPQEIVYPCIPDPDGEDEGGQASSSLAVSTRWISATKLLQSDLATLAQREGGE